MSSGVTTLRGPGVTPSRDVTPSRARNVTPSQARGSRERVADLRRRMALGQQSVARPPGGSVPVTSIDLRLGKWGY